MQMIGLARLGRDAELRTTQSGEKVASLSLAFNWGMKGQDGNRPTQWVDGSLWGKRAEVLVDEDAVAAGEGHPQAHRRGLSGRFHQPQPPRRSR